MCGIDNNIKKKFTQRNNNMRLPEVLNSTMLPPLLSPLKGSAYCCHHHHHHKHHHHHSSRHRYHNHHNHHFGHQQQQHQGHFQCQHNLLFFIIIFLSMVSLLTNAAPMPPPLAPPTSATSFSSSSNIILSSKQEENVTNSDNTSSYVNGRLDDDYNNYYITTTFTNTTTTTTTTTASTPTIQQTLNASVLIETISTEIIKSSTTPSSLNTLNYYGVLDNGDNEMSKEKNLHLNNNKKDTIIKENNKNKYLKKPLQILTEEKYLDIGKPPDEMVDKNNNINVNIPSTSSSSSSSSHLLVTEKTTTPSITKTTTTILSPTIELSSVSSPSPILPMVIHQSGKSNDVNNVPSSTTSSITTSPITTIDPYFISGSLLSDLLMENRELDHSGGRGGGKSQNGQAINDKSNDENNFPLSQTAVVQSITNQKFGQSRIDLIKSHPEMDVSQLTSNGILLQVNSSTKSPATVTLVSPPPPPSPSLQPLTKPPLTSVSTSTSSLVRQQTPLSTYTLPPLFPSLSKASSSLSLSSSSSSSSSLSTSMFSFDKQEEKKNLQAENIDSKIIENSDRDMKINDFLKNVPATSTTAAAVAALAKEIKSKKPIRIKEETTIIQTSKATTDDVTIVVEGSDDSSSGGDGGGGDGIGDIITSISDSVLSSNGNKMMVNQYNKKKSLKKVTTTPAAASTTIVVESTSAEKINEGILEANVEPNINYEIISSSSNNKNAIENKKTVKILEQENITKVLNGSKIFAQSMNNNSNNISSSSSEVGGNVDLSKKYISTKEGDSSGSFVGSNSKKNLMAWDSVNKHNFKNNKKTNSNKSSGILSSEKFVESTLDNNEKITSSTLDNSDDGLVDTTTIPLDSSTEILSSSSSLIKEIYSSTATTTTTAIKPTSAAEAEATSSVDLINDMKSSFGTDKLIPTLLAVASLSTPTAPPPTPLNTLPDIMTTLSPLIKLNSKPIENVNDEKLNVEDDGDDDDKMNSQWNERIDLHEEIKPTFPIDKHNIGDVDDLVNRENLLLISSTETTIMTEILLPTSTPRSKLQNENEKMHVVNNDDGQLSITSPTPQTPPPPPPLTRQSPLSPTTINAVVDVETVVTKTETNILDNVQNKNDTYDDNWNHSDHNEPFYDGGNNHVVNITTTNSVDDNNTIALTTETIISSSNGNFVEDKESHGYNLDDDLFNVVVNGDESGIGGNGGISDDVSIDGDDIDMIDTKQLVTEKTLNKILEADSEEFFIPEDIKERATKPPSLPTYSTKTVVYDGTLNNNNNNNDDDDGDSRSTKKSTTVNHDAADTIFYISNTEVKVVESVPTPNSNQENQFFPAIYEEDVIIDFSSKNFSGWGNIPDKYEEDIILSPLKNSFDPTKLDNDNKDMSISYVGESFIEVKEFTSSGAGGGSESSIINTPTSHPYLGNTLNSGGNINDESVVQIIPSKPETSSVLFQKQQQQLQPISIPIIAELPPQIGSELNNYHQQQQQPSVNDDDDDNDNNDNENFNNILVTQEEGLLLQNSLKKNELNAELPISIQEYVIVNGKPIPAKRNNLPPVNGTIKTSSNKISDLGATSADAAGVVIIGASTAAAGSVVGVSTSTVGAAASVVNATAYLILDDEPENSENIFFGFNDIQTLFVACMATLAPLISCVLLGFGVRYFWRKYRRDHSNSNGIVGDNSTDPLAVKSRTVSADELKSTESGYSINRSNDTLESSAEILSKFDGSIMAHKTNHSGANGSVITMTLKNNHLIVETEERNDMARDARETKMHYSPSEKDGVFVVEASRGADSNGALMANGKLNSEAHLFNINKDKHNTVTVDNMPNQLLANGKLSNYHDDGSFLKNNDIQVHHPPTTSTTTITKSIDNNNGTSDDELLTVDTDGAVSMSSPKFNGADDSMRPFCGGNGSTNTGLSQSDLSISSSCGSNQDYCYGSQDHYTVDTRGYQSSSPHINCIDLKKSNSFNDPNPNHQSTSISSTIIPSNSNYINSSTSSSSATASSTSSSSKPIITAAIYKQESVDQATSYPEDGRPGKLRTDKNAFQPLAIVEEIITKPIEIKEYTLNEEQRLLGNGSITAIDGDDNDVATGHGEESGPFDSIISLPAPPTIDEIKQLNDIQLMDNNNMDSLPPPPPPSEIIIAIDGSAINGES